MFRLTVVFALLGCALAGVIEPRASDTGRIVGGEETDINDHPYQVALLKDGSIFCGGSLISNNMATTAAHCLQSYKAPQIKVRLGSSTYKSGGEVVSVSAFRFHEGYDARKIINDVGLIKFSTPVRFTDKIQPIPLATVMPKTGTPAVVTGWGTNAYLFGSIQKVLHKAEVEIIERNDCIENSKYGNQILETMVCAGVEDSSKDACQGDSGGPLVAGGKLVGIVSWGNMCARKNYPGVYSSVPELVSWIEENAKTL